MFSGRYKALVVDGSGSGYLKTVCDYVHLNPVRANLLGSAERLLSYPWSSLVWYVAFKLKEELERRGWVEEDLARRRKRDPEKLAIAARLRKETTLPIKGIAARVRLGTSKSANTNLHKWMQTVEK